MRLEKFSVTHKNLRIVQALLRRSSGTSDRAPSRVLPQHLQRLADSRKARAEANGILVDSHSGSEPPKSSVSR